VYLDCGRLPAGFLFCTAISPLASPKQPKNVSFRIKQIRNAISVSLLFLYSCEIVGVLGGVFHSTGDQTRKLSEEPAERPGRLPLRLRELCVLCGLCVNSDSLLRFNLQLWTVNLLRAAFSTPHGTRITNR
jgi:hypothetical protein